MKCVILGGAGFVGSNLATHLVRQGADVTVLDRDGPRTALLAKQIPKLKCFTGNVEQEEFLDEAVRGRDVLFYLAHTTIPAAAEHDPSSDISTNIFPLLKVTAAAAKAGIKRIVQTSSGGTVYGRAQTTPIPETHPTDPLCAYGICKLAIEKYTRLYASRGNIESVCLRLANPYGPGQSMTGQQGAVSVFLGRMLRKEAIEIWGDGNVVRDYVHIADVASALEAAALVRLPEPHMVINIGTGVGTSLLELIRLLEETTGLRAEVRFQSARALDVPVNVLDICRARRFLGYMPRFDLRRGVKERAVSVRVEAQAARPAS